jgi:hypothetical protein
MAQVRQCDSLGGRTECKRSASPFGVKSHGYLSLRQFALPLNTIPSHQTTKFPPTPYIRSTSASQVRMIKLQYYTFTVTNEPANIPRDSPPPHVPAFLPLTIFLSVHAGTAGTPIPSYVYFTTCGHPGVGASGTGFSLCSFIAPAKIRIRSPPHIFRESGLQPRP